MTDDKTTTDDATDDDATDDDGEPDPLEAIRADPAAALRTQEALKAESADYRRRLRKIEAELETTRTASLTDQERAVAEAEQRGRDAALAENGRRLLEAQILAAGAGKLTDPGDALRHLDLEALLELEEGDRELGKRIDGLLTEKPYLAATTGNGAGANGVRQPGARTAPGGAKAADTDGSAWLRHAAKRGRA